jgi:DNA-binding NarL/FixJ family response regulator
VRSNHRILLVDEHPVVRRGLKDLLEFADDLLVCGEASTGRMALKLMNSQRPDLVIIGLALPDMQDVELVREIRKLSRKTEVLIFGRSSEANAGAALEAGALGWLDKATPETELLYAIDQLRHHRPYVSSGLTLTGAGRTTNLQPAAVLTLRQIEVLNLLVKGLSNRQIGIRLRISTRTVEAHRLSIMRRLQLHKFSHLIRYAIRTGIGETKSGH